MIQKIDGIYQIIADKQENKSNNIDQKVSIDWSMFDKIVCIHFLPYKERLEPIKKELARVGILDLPQFEWYFTVSNNAYESADFIGKNEVTSSNVKYTIDSINLLSKYAELGYQKVLVIEDDCKFISNTTEIAKYINNIPKDFDIVSFEYFLVNDDQHIKSYQFNKIDNEEYLKVESGWIYDTSFIAFSHKALEYLVFKQKQEIRPFDHYTFKYNDSELLHCYISKQRLCNNVNYRNKQETNTTFNQKENQLAAELFINHYVEKTNKQIIPIVFNYYERYEILLKFQLYTLVNLQYSIFHMMPIYLLMSQNDFDKHWKELDAYFTSIKNYDTQTIHPIIMSSMYDFKELDSIDRVFDETALYRLFIPFANDLKQFKKIIYLDTDIFISNDIDFQEMHIDDDFYIAARSAENEKRFFTKNNQMIEDYQKYLNDLGKTVFGQYFNVEQEKICNSGVLVINQKKFSQNIDKYKEILFHCLRFMKHLAIDKHILNAFKWPDQDILNLLLEKLDKLDVKYNFKSWYLYRLTDTIKIYQSLSFQYYQKFMEKYKIKILHFQGNQNEQGKKVDLMNIIKSNAKFLDSLR